MNTPRIPSARHGGFLMKALLVCALLFVVACVAWVVLLPGIVAATIHSRTGFTVKIDKLSVNPFLSVASVSGLVVQNPDGWPEPKFIDIRQFKADIRLWSWLGGKFVANDVVADVAQVTLVKNQKGELNSTVFSNGFSSQKPAAPAGGNPPASNPKSQGFMIHHLVLKFDKLRYADYSRAGRPYLKDYDINLDREMTDVDSMAKLISPLTGSALGLMASAFGGMSPKDADALTQAVDLLQGAGRKTGQSLKNLLQSLDNKKP